MANNTIGWGQGATNNNIGWGRGSSNDIGWGSVYDSSYVGDTDIIGGDTRFIITVKTDNAGTSASNQFTLPWIGTYDVEWGDGSSDVGVSGTQTHTYASAGTYDVAVTAATGQILFFGTTDKAKLIDIKNWGSIQWTTMLNSFRECLNLGLITASDNPNLSLATTTSYMFAFSSNFNGDLSGWNMSGITNISRMFYNASSFNSDIGNWDVSSVVDMQTLFLSASSFNQNLNNWDTSSVTTMVNMFNSAGSFKQSLAGLDIASVTNFTNFALNTQINESGTTTNYDNTLISWAAQTPQNNIVINFGTAKYSNAAAAARELLTRAVVDGGYGWTITDGGGVDLLDTYTGAAAAYSLRTIKSSTTKVVRVRADVVGQPEQDFTAAEITDGTLATFVGAGNNGYVVTWYDQSGLGNHATQGTASNQPQIVASGVVITENGMPAIYSNNKYIFNNTVSSSVPATDFFIYKTASVLAGAYQCYYDGYNAPNNRGFFGLQKSNLKDVIFDGVVLESYNQTLNQTLATNVRNSASSQGYKNDALQVTGNSGTFNPLNGLTFGRDNLFSTTIGSDVYYQEFIRFDGVSPNISDINANINDYYNIY